MRRRLAFLTLIAVCALGLPSAAVAASASKFDGRLTIHHADDFRHDTSTTRYGLVDGNRTMKLAPAIATRIPAGTRVVVKGRRSGDKVIGTVRDASGVAHPAAAHTGRWRVAVLLVNFADSPIQPWSPASVNQSSFIAPNSTAAYYSTQSWGKVTVSGDTYGWYTIPANGGTCNVDTWAQQARSAATAAGVNLNAYDSVAYAFPYQQACSWAGLAEMPGRQFWLNGDVSTRVFAHELGHNMGVHHAASLSCTNNGIPVAVSSTCTMDEYGDPFDVMGARARQMGGWHLEQLGYLSGGNIQTVTADGTYTLRSTLAATTDTQLIRIPRNSAASPREYYYIDLRAAGGAFDTFGATDPEVNGATIRIGNDPNVLKQSELIDTTPGSRGGFADAPLGVGRTFSDGNVNVTLTALDGGVATLQVQFGTAPPDIYPPSAPGAPRVIDSGGTALNLTWDEASDNLAVVGYHVKRDGQTIATVTDPSYLDSDVVQGRAYSYSIEAYDAAGNATTGTATTAALPPAATPPAAAPPAPPAAPAGPAADTTAPTVDFRSPGRSAHLRTRALIKTVARDRGGIDKLELYVDDKRRAVSRSGQLDFAWALGRVKPGQHRLKVVAIDDSHNSASRSLTVRVVASR